MIAVGAHITIHKGVPWKGVPSCPAVAATDSRTARSQERVTTILPDSQSMFTVGAPITIHKGVPGTGVPSCLAAVNGFVNSFF